MNSLAYN